MSADFWAGYLSGAAGILIGNPLDLVKTRLQAGNPHGTTTTTTTTPTTISPAQSFKSHFDHAGTLVRGATAPILGYGALNAILFVTYNRTLSFLSSSSTAAAASPSALSPPPSYLDIYIAGAASGLATFVVSAPTELIKCRAQVGSASTSSLSIAREIWRHEGVRGLYYGGGITSVRDAVGYGFYFLSYEWSKLVLGSPEDTQRQAAMKVLLCGGLAGIVTWASIFPLDVVKTRVQTQMLHVPLLEEGERRGLLQSEPRYRTRLSTFEVAKQAYQAEGAKVFFRGLGICSVRAFVVNAVQWAVYEWMMKLLQKA